MIGITGSRGVLGRVFVERLLQNNIELSLFDGDICRNADVQNWISVSKPDAVFHFAARVAVDKVAEDPIGAFDINALGTANLVHVLSQHAKGAWLFYAGTSHVYGGSSVPIREEALTDPHSIYGRSKLLGEQIAEYFGRYGGLKVCVGRIFSFYHPTQKPPFLYPAMIARLKNHPSSEPFVVRNGMDVRDFLNAEQVVDLILKLYECEATGVVNIGSGTGTRVVDFVRDLAGKGVGVEVDQQQEPTVLVADTTRLRGLVDGC